MIEEPTSVAKPQIGHAVPRMKASKRNTRRQGARPVVQSELVRRVSALNRSGLVQACAQPEHGRGDWEALGFVSVEQRVGPAADDVRQLPAQVVKQQGGGDCCGDGRVNFSYSLAPETRLSADPWLILAQGVSFPNFV
jgi:hypothetical protein